ncbi:UV radiation resistance-associated protein-like isoform X2 [Antedon mediterranea]|uniref:UV radiation resistance-associated protein-like isoform X2 n=1 Tax=Antedon mediterranea TaxID=105859 RepID=UPI003AF5DD44
MSNSENIGRLVHVNLSTQQRRLRHLRSLSARNIQTDKSHGKKDALIETYFTLHTFDNKEAIYTSEKILDSLNPTWRSFDLSRSCDDVDTALPGLIVRVWGGTDEQFKLIIEWKVDLQGLRYLGEYINNENLKYQPNSLIFGMFEGFYGATEKERIEETYVSGLDRKLEVEQSSVRLSYTTYSLSRVHTAQRAIKQTQVSVGKVQHKIENHLDQLQAKTKVFSEKETLLLRVSMLRNEVRHQRNLVKLQKQKADASKNSIQDKLNKFSISKEKFNKEKEELREKKTELYKKREEFIETNRNLAIRKRSLVGELSYIYPITEQTDGSMSILGVKLPNAEDYSGTDDTTIAVALGHTCHLLHMISQIQMLPSRYPMVHLSSRSVIRDHITKLLADKDRDFPLYTKGKERFQFRYAVYLLNRNVAQLRYALGLATSDLRATLPNLKSLLELKWGVNKKYDTDYDEGENVINDDDEESENPRLSTIYQEKKKRVTISSDVQVAAPPSASGSQNEKNVVSPPPSYESSMKGHMKQAAALTNPPSSGDPKNQNDVCIREVTDHSNSSGSQAHSPDKVTNTSKENISQSDSKTQDIKQQINGVKEGTDVRISDPLTESSKEKLEDNLTGQSNLSRTLDDILHFDDIHSRADALQHHRQSFSSFRGNLESATKNSKDNKKL